MSFTEPRCIFNFHLKLMMVTLSMNFYVYTLLNVYKCTAHRQIEENEEKGIKELAKRWNCLCICFQKLNPILFHPVFSFSLNSDIHLNYFMYKATELDLKILADDDSQIQWLAHLMLRTYGVWENVKESSKQEIRLQPNIKLAALK